MGATAAARKPEALAGVLALHPSGQSRIAPAIAWAEDAVEGSTAGVTHTNMTAKGAVRCERVRLCKDCFDLGLISFGVRSSVRPESSGAKSGHGSVGIVQLRAE